MIVQSRGMITGRHQPALQVAAMKAEQEEMGKAASTINSNNPKLPTSTQPRIRVSPTVNPHESAPEP